MIVRNTHIVRLYGFNGGDDFDDDTWLEFQRIDSWLKAGGRGANYQDASLVFDWSIIEQMEIDNGPGGTDDSGNPKLGWREEGVIDNGNNLIFARKKVHNPDNDDQYVIVPTLLLIPTRIGRGASFSDGLISFDNTDQNERRRVRIDRISHVDNVNDPNSAVDDSQKIDVEVLLVWSRNADRYERFQAYDHLIAGNDGNDTDALPGHREELDLRID